MNGETLDLHAMEESLGEHAARLDAEKCLDQDTLARVLVVYTGGTIGMMIKDGGLYIYIYWAMVDHGPPHFYSVGHKCISQFHSDQRFNLAARVSLTVWFRFRP